MLHWTVEIAPAPLAPGARLEAFARAHPASGAVASFLGQVRDVTPDDPTRALFLQSHPELTEPGIREACAETSSRFALDGGLVLHRTGEIAKGEPIVLVACASRHRRDALGAVDFLMDYLKTRAVFWKREDKAGGSHWVEPREQDYQDARRWTA